jgi:hypothetical protein
MTPRTTKSALPCLNKWANREQNLPGEKTNKIVQDLLNDSSVIKRLDDLTDRLTLKVGRKKALNAIAEMLDNCILFSEIIVDKYNGTVTNSRLTHNRTEQSKELLALAKELKSVQKKLKDLSFNLDNAISVSYLTARHQAGNPTEFSKRRLLSLRIDRPTFSDDLSITHLLAALHDDVVEVAGRVKKSILKKRQPSGHDKLSTAMIDAIWRAVRNAIGEDSPPPPTLLVVEICRVLFTAHGYDKTPNESTVLSRIKRL